MLLSFYLFCSDSLESSYKSEGVWGGRLKEGKIPPGQAAVNELMESCHENIQNMMEKLENEGENKGKTVKQKKQQMEKVELSPSTPEQECAKEANKETEELTQFTSKSTEKKSNFHPISQEIQPESIKHKQETRGEKIKIKESPKVPHENCPAKEIESIQQAKAESSWKQGEKSSEAQECSKGSKIQNKH
jgi:hypothetical protein